MRSNPIPSRFRVSFPSISKPVLAIGVPPDSRFFESVRRKGWHARQLHICVGGCRRIAARLGERGGSSKSRFDFSAQASRRQVRRHRPIRRLPQGAGDDQGRRGRSPRPRRRSISSSIRARTIPAIRGRTGAIASRSMASTTRRSAIISPRRAERPRRNRNRLRLRIRSREEEAAAARRCAEVAHAAGGPLHAGQDSRPARPRE